jgi:glycosyltransferase involved in cell wall biosynthesis
VFRRGGATPGGGRAAAAHVKSNRLLVQGWRFIHHSYALVAQAHCLALLRRGDVDLRFEDLAFHGAHWQPSRGILDAADEATLGALRGPDEHFVPEATLRFWPAFSAPSRGRRFVFDTPELRVLRPGVRRSLQSGASAPDGVHVLTPSGWAAVAYERFGFPPARIHVVPHGFDPGTFHPDAARREAMRRELGLADRFVFLNVGGVTANKGIDILLRAFARTLAGAPNACLVLKGSDDLYASRDLLQQLLATLTASEREAVSERLIYLGERKSTRWMADLLRAADFYVAPYLAEGFNLPVLEAAACGVAVICTGGGPTDEFTEPSFAWRIQARLVGARLPKGELGECLKPDEEHLSELMLQAASEPMRACAIGAQGAEYVAQRYTWDKVTERLFAELFRASHDDQLGSSRR